MSDRTHIVPGSDTIPVGAFLPLAREEVGDLDLERAGHGVDVQQPEVALTALDSADVGAVQFGSLGQILLAETKPLTQLSDAFTERAELGGKAPAHHARTMPGHRR